MESETYITNTACYLELSIMQGGKLAQLVINCLFYAGEFDSQYRTDLAHAVTVMIGLL